MTVATKDELRGQIAQLRAKRTASTDKAEKDRLLAQIQDLENQVTALDLQDGRDALERTKAAAAKADEAANAKPHDALSALGRQADKARSPKP
jgi:hypothetical protein